MVSTAFFVLCEITPAAKQPILCLPWSGVNVDRSLRADAAITWLRFY
jgi:hypothetical protein